MTRTRRFVGGVAAGYVNLAVATLVGLWLTPFLLDRLGQYDFGLWLLCGQIVGYLLLLDLGVIALVPRETAITTGRAGGLLEPNALHELIAKTRWLVRWQTCALGALALAVWLFLPSEWAALRGPLAVVLLVLVAAFPLRVCGAVLQGLQELTFIGGSQLAAWTAGTVLTVLLVLGGFGLYALAAGWAFTLLATNLLALARLRWRYPQVLPLRSKAVSARGVRGYLGQSLWVSMSQLAQVLLNATDMLVIGHLIGPVAVVLYACTGKLVAVMMNLPLLMTQAAMPALSELRVAGSREKLQQTVAALTLGVMTVSGFVACVVVTVNRGFVGWWVGAAQFDGVLLTVLLVGGMLLRHWNATLVYGLFCFGRERRISLTTLADGMVSVGLAVLLVSRLGLVGAPIASIVAVTIVSLPANLAALSSATGSSISTFVIALWPWAGRFAALLAMACLSMLWWVPETPLSLLSTAAVVAAVYGVVMLRALLTTPLGLYLRPHLPGGWVGSLVTSGGSRSAERSIS